MSLWVTIPVSAYKVGTEFGLWDKIRASLKTKQKILILGASGVGKSKFVDSLAPLLPSGSTGHRRTVDVHRRRVPIEKTQFDFFDTPGQILDEAKRKKAITRAIREGFEGIINVVCYGYHEAEEGGFHAAVPKSAGKIAKVPYLRKRQAVEMDLLAEWVPLIDQKTAKWIMTIVTKADLWWPDTEGEISTHYQEGEYADALDGFADCHYLLPYCSVIEPFYGTRTSGVFGDHHRGALRENLLKTILRLSGAAES